MNEENICENIFLIYNSLPDKVYDKLELKGKSSIFQNRNNLKIWVIKVLRRNEDNHYNTIIIN